MGKCTASLLVVMCLVAPVRTQHRDKRACFVRERYEYRRKYAVNVLKYGVSMWWEVSSECYKYAERLTSRSFVRLRDHLDCV